MNEVVRFISRAEREQARLIREARALYDSIFPPADPVGEHRNRASDNYLTGAANSSRSDGIGPS